MDVEVDGVHGRDRAEMLRETPSDYRRWRTSHSDSDSLEVLESSERRIRIREANEQTPQLAILPVLPTERLEESHARVDQFLVRLRVLDARVQNFERLRRASTATFVLHRHDGRLALRGIRPARDLLV